MTLRTRIILIRILDLAAIGLLLGTIGACGAAAAILRTACIAVLLCTALTIPRSPALRCPDCGKPLRYSVLIRSTCRYCGFRFINWRG